MLGQHQSSLDCLISKMYNQRLQKVKNNGNPHHMFTPFLNLTSQKIEYFAVMELPAFMHTSDEVIGLARKRYGEILPAFEIILVERNFQSVSYLVKSKKNIIQTTKMISIQRQCGEFLSQNLLFSIITFLTENQKRMEKTQSSQLIRLSQLGFLENQEICLSDIKLFFRSIEQFSLKQHPSTIQDNLRLLFYDIFLIQEGKSRIQILEAIQNVMGPSIDKDLEDLITLTCLREITESEIYQTINKLIYKMDDANTTLTESIDERIDNSFERKRSFGENGSNKGSMAAVKNNKIGCLPKSGIIILFVILLGIAGYFSYAFFNRNVICGQGEYIGEKNQCLGCTQGCLRCNQGDVDKCFSCKSTLYLVLNNQMDKQGRCLATCEGRKWKSNVCVTDKSSVELLQE